MFSKTKKDRQVIMTLNPGAAAGAPLASLPTPPASVAVSNNSFGRSSSEEILQELLLTATEAGGVGRLAGGAAEAAVWLGVILALRSFLVFEVGEAFGNFGFFVILQKCKHLTSVLPSNWNLGKIFAPKGQLGQVHMVQ